MALVHHLVLTQNPEPTVAIHEGSTLRPAYIGYDEYIHNLDKTKFLSSVKQNVRPNMKFQLILRL